jgi:hypothetical protein
MTVVSPAHQSVAPAQRTVSHYHTGGVSYRTMRTIHALLLCLFLSAPAIAADAPAALFNGKDLSGWKVRDDKAKNHWKWVADAKLAADPKKLEGVGAGGSPESVLLNGDVGTDLITEAAYGDVKVEVEFLLAKESNSGLFLIGQYEVQVTDSFGIADKDLRPGDCGGLPWTKAASVNACKKPGEWQRYEITFRAPKFEGGKKVKSARIEKTVLNGKTVMENVDIPEPTGGGIEGDEKPAGPLLLQGNEGVVAFRNLKVTPLK